MATIEIQRTHELPLDDVKAKAEQLAKDMESKLNMQWQWKGDRIHFEAKKGAAKGTKGHVSVDDSEVRVEIDLPFLLRAMKGTIASKVNAKLDGLLG